MQSTELADFSFSRAFIPNFPSVPLYLYVLQLINQGIPGSRHGGHDRCPQDTQEAWCCYRS